MGRLAAAISRRGAQAGGRPSHRRHLEYAQASAAHHNLQKFRASTTSWTYALLKGCT
jgi:hypothetical protein